MIVLTFLPLDDAVHCRDKPKLGNQHAIPRGLTRLQVVIVAEQERIERDLRLHLPASQTAHDTTSCVVA